MGKTEVAIEVARYFKTSIVSADSRQCYRQMNIGTAKPSITQLNNIKHYFINEYDISTLLTAADFEQLALQYIGEIFGSNDVAIVCGGTGLYIKALCEGLDAMPQVDAEIENSVNEQYKQNGLGWLQEEVKNNDPLFYNSGEIYNPSRLLRALVFKLSTNESITAFRTGIKKQRPFRIIKAGLELPRETLYARINKRVDDMIKAGLEEEVRSLHLYKNLKNLQTVGYTELFEFLDGNYTLAEAISKIKQHTRNYAKRQLTWFKKDEEIRWLRADKEDIAKHIAALV